MADGENQHIRQDLFDASFLGKVEQLALMARRMATSGQRAQRRSRKVGSGIEFADHRDYEPGDDLRGIDWNLFARTERLQLRQYEEEEDLSVYFLLDRSSSMGMAADGETHLLDRALQVTAALAYISLSNLDRVAVVPFDDHAPPPMRPLRGKSQFFRILRALSAVRLGWQDQHHPVAAAVYPNAATHWSGRDHQRFLRSDRAWRQFARFGVARL